MNGAALKELARALAMVKHEGVSRKGIGEPYFNHVERVAEGVWGWRAKTIAYLHDVPEDNREVTFDVLLTMGFPKDIVADVALLTRPGDGEMTYADYIQRLVDSGSKDALRVKLSDLTDNLRDIDDMPKGDSQKRRYERAKADVEEALA